MTWFLVCLFSVLGLASHVFAGYCGYRYGRRVEASVQAALAAARIGFRAGA